MSNERFGTRISLHLARLIYLFLIVLSFYLLFMSRSGELHTVWEVIHPAFMPTLLLATALLVGMLFSSEKAGYKLFFVVLHSILLHTFVIVIYPVGYAGVNQIILGRTRRVFDNLVLHGPWGLVSPNILSQLYSWTRGTNLQTSFTVVLARMFGVDVYWSHLLLVPVLWGVFVPIIVFKTTKALGKSESVSLFSSFLISLFPTLIFNGAVSVPNSLGYLFFFCSICFSLMYIFSGGFKAFLLMGGFCVVSFLSHFLTGAFSLSLVPLALALRKYSEAEGRSGVMAKVLMLFSVIFSVSLLPWALVSQSLVYPVYTRFSFENLSDLSLVDKIWLVLLGEYVNFDVKNLLIQGIGPLLGVIGLAYSFVIKPKTRKNHHLCEWFLLLVFLAVLIDYRILRLLMVGVPFGEERLWPMRDFVLVPFVGVLIGGLLSFVRKRTLNYRSARNKIRWSFRGFSSRGSNVGFVGVALIAVVSVSSLVTASVYYSYPHAAAFQITSYEIEAVNFIETTTNERYVVICDQFVTYAGQTLVGLNNPRAYYFYHSDYRCIRWFNELKEKPSPGPMIEAMNVNDAAVAYFVVEKPRLRLEEFERVVSQASLSLKTYGIFGDGKLYIFYYEKNI